MQTFWLWLDRLTILIAIWAAGFAFWAWLRTTQLIRANRTAAERRKAPIRIRLRRIDPNQPDDSKTDNHGKHRILELPYRPRRDQLSRAELVGILGLYYGPERFETDLLLPVLENGSLSRVIAGENDESSEDETLVIDFKPEVFDKFAKRMIQHDE